MRYINYHSDAPLAPRHRESRAGLTLIILASGGLWLICGLWLWRLVAAWAHGLQ